MDETEHTELARFISQLPPTDSEGEEVEAVLTKFVLVCDWIDGDGSRYLTRRSGSGLGEALPHWEAKGLLHEALFGSFKE